MYEFVFKELKLRLPFSDFQSGGLRAFGSGAFLTALEFDCLYKGF